MSVTIEEVENFSSTGWEQLNQDKKEAMLEVAEDLINNQLSRRMSRFSTLEGNRDHAIMLMCSHLLELAQGGESQSDSTQGGSVSYNTVTGEWQQSLTETRYGRMLSDLYLRDRQGLSIVRTH